MTGTVRTSPGPIKKRVVLLTIRARRFWIVVLTSLLPLPVIAWLFEKPAEPILTFGVMLEGYGLYRLAIGIGETARRFGKPTLGDAAKSWLREFFSSQKATIVGGIGSASAAAHASAEGYVWSTVNPNDPIEKRVEVLQKNVDTLQSLVARLGARQTKEFSEVRNALEKTRSEYTAELAKLHGLLEQQVAGDIWSEYMGLGWLFCGLLLTNYQERLATALQGLVRFAGL